MTNVGIANNIGYLYFLWFYRWTTSRNLGLWGAPQLIRETMRWDWPTSGSCSQNSDIQPERPLRRSRNTSFTTWSLSLSRYPVFVYKMWIVTHFFSSFFLPPPSPIGSSSRSLEGKVWSISFSWRNIGSSYFTQRSFGQVIGGGGDHLWACSQYL